jgi:RNA polymerase sigma-70 factor (ECF subfamily)
LYHLFVRFLPACAFKRSEGRKGFLDESAAITLVREGNSNAFAGIVEHYQAPLQRYLYRLTGDFELSKDLAQDTFVQAYKSILKTDSELSLRAWLYRIAENNARQHFRRKKLISFLPFSSPEKEENMADSRAAETEQSLAIAEALKKIQPKQRSCLVLHFVEGFRYREIAEILGISEEAVRKRVTRGSLEFRKLYGAGGGGR